MREPLSTYFHIHTHPPESVRPNGPKVRQKCIFDKNFWGVQPDFCQKSHK